VEEARRFLISSLLLALGSDKKIITSSENARRHSFLRGRAFDKRIDIKAARFMRDRVLGKLPTTFESTDLLRRERSSLYKR
jgi:hypothetical protein